MSAEVLQIVLPQDARDERGRVIESEDRNSAQEEINLQMQKRAVESMLNELLAQARRDGNYDAINELSGALSQLSTVSNYTQLRAALSSAYQAISLAQGQGITGNQTQIAIISLDIDQTYPVSSLSDEQISDYAYRWYEGRYSRDAVDLTVGVVRQNVPSTSNMDVLTLAKVMEPQASLMDSPAPEGVQFRADARTLRDHPVVADEARADMQLAKENFDFIMAGIQNGTIEVTPEMQQRLDRLQLRMDQFTPGEEDRRMFPMDPDLVGVFGNMRAAYDQSRARGEVGVVSLVQYDGELASATSRLENRLQQVEGMVLGDHIDELYRDAVYSKFGITGPGLNEAARAAMAEVDVDDFRSALSSLQNPYLSEEEVRDAHATIGLYLTKFNTYSIMVTESLAGHVRDIYLAQRRGEEIDPQTQERMALLSDPTVPTERKVDILMEVSSQRPELEEMTRNLPENERRALLTRFVTGLAEESTRYPRGVMDYAEAVLNAGGDPAQVSQLINGVMMPPGTEWNHLDADEQARYALVTQLRPEISRNEIFTIDVAASRSAGAPNPVGGLFDAFSESAVERALKTGLTSGRNDVRIDSLGLNAEDAALLHSIDTKNGGAFFGILNNGADGKLSVDEIKIVLEANGVTFTEQAMADGIDAQELAQAIRAARAAQQSEGRTP